MCIAVYSTKGNDVPDRSTLEMCFNANPDGAGFAFNTDNGQVRIRKGFMDFESFIGEFERHKDKYGFRDRGVLMHFRIATHGAQDMANCHPFPITSNQKKLRKTETDSEYACVHNGIIHLTSDIARKEKKNSDTMIFVRDYLSLIASNRHWFDTPSNTELIHNLIDSKMAILNGKGDIIATPGFEKGADGNYYSNDSYMGTYSYGLYDLFLYDKVPLMRLDEGETAFFDDGITEEYDKVYHGAYPLFITESGEILGCYDGAYVGQNISSERLTYLGDGIICDDHSLMSGNLSVPFRKDAMMTLSRENEYDFI